MPKLKRTNDKQITKDSYDRGEEESRFPEEPDPGQGMKRASENVMKGRKIIRASRKFVAPSSSAAPTKTAAANDAFASTKLVAKNDPIMPSSSSNPFAQVQLNAGTTAPPPLFSFGAGPKTTEPEPKPFSFASTSSSSSLSYSKQSSPPSSSNPTDVNGEQIEKTNRDLFQMIQDHVNKGHVCTDLSLLMKQYINVVENLQSSDNQDGVSLAFPGGESSITDDGKSKSQSITSSFSGHSFAPSSSAPPPSSKPTIFSFTGGSVTAPVAAAPSFPFGAQPAATSGGGSGNFTANEDDPTSNPDDGTLEVGQEENKDEETRYEVVARLVKLNDGSWQKFGKGTLRLYHNTVTDKKRMVLRNGVGKVMFNVGISKGMPFNKDSIKSENGVKSHVKFMAVENDSEGLKHFMLNVKPDYVDKFHEELEKMAA